MESSRPYTPLRPDLQSARRVHEGDTGPKVVRSSRRGRSALLVAERHVCDYAGASPCHASFSVTRLLRSPVAPIELLVFGSSGWRVRTSAPVLFAVHGAREPLGGQIVVCAIRPGRKVPGANSGPVLRRAEGIVPCAPAQDNLLPTAVISRPLVNARSTPVSSGRGGPCCQPSLDCPRGSTRVGRRVAEAGLARACDRGREAPGSLRSRGR